MANVWLTSLWQRHLDVRVPIGREFEAQIVERPGLWMAPARRDKLIGHLKAVTAANLKDSELAYGSLGGDADTLDNTIFTVIVRKHDGNPVAFNALPILQINLDRKIVEVQHLGLVMIDPSAQKQGFSWALYGLTCFLLFIRNQLRPIWLSSVTQVPAVVGMVAETFSDAYPHPVNGSQKSFAQLQLGRAIMAQHRAAFGVGPEAEFDEDRFIIKNAYTGGSDALKKGFATAARHRIAAYNDYCEAELDYNRGDDCLQIARLDLAAAKRYLVELVPGRSIGPLLVSALLLIVKYITIPVIHWFDSSSQMGSLRPR